MYLHRASIFDYQQMEEVPDMKCNRFQDRYQEAEPSICAFIPEENLKDRLLHDAAELSAGLNSKKELPPLWGLPVAVKDLIHVDGLPTRAGSNLPPEILTSHEGSLIAALRTQGALFAGKTVTEEFAYHSVIPTRNPHDTEHTPGGSSAGSAASVAAGICPLAIGTQTLRSLIAPASFCGVVGFKPSYGRVPIDGTIQLSPSMDTIGFFTQDIAGLENVASHLIPRWHSFYSDRKPVLGVPNGVYMSFMFDEVRQIFEHQLLALAKAGYIICRVDMPWEDSFIAGDAMLRMVQAEMAQVHKDWFNEYRHLYGDSVKNAIRSGQKIPPDELEHSRRGQLELRLKLEEVRRQQGIDIWVSPAQGGVAPKGFDCTGWSGMTSVWSYAGLPAISIPAAKINGLPLGFQLIGSFNKDEELLFWADGVGREQGLGN